MRFPGKTAIVSFLLFFLLSMTASAFASPLFQSDSRYATGMTPVKFAASDLDGDGLLDLAVVNSQTLDLSVLIGKGDGSFGAATSYPLGFKPRAIAVSDFNNDGYPDAVVSCYDSCSHGLYLLLNQGDGSFGSATRIPGIANGDELTAADFNGDGDMDLAVFHLGGSGKHMYSVLLGDGSGALTLANSYESLENAASMVSGDFNGDGKPDIAFLLSGNKKLAIALNEDDGSLRLPFMHNTETNPVALAQGLFNDDLLPDLAVVHMGGAQRGVTIFIGQGDGNFEPSSTTYRIENSYAVATGDLDGDGKTDLAVANFNDNEIAVLQGNGDGSFLPTQRYLLGGKGPTGILIADLNGDGLNDLMTLNQLSHDVSVWLGNGSMNLDLPRVYPSGYAPTDIQLGDFDGDGRVEAILPNWGGYSIVRGTSSTDFSLNSNYGLAGGDEVSGLAVADFNQDGYSDFALLNATKNRIEIRLGSAGSTIAHTDISPGVALTDIAIGDFNGDGKPDIAVTSESGNALIVLIGAGDGTFIGQTFYVGSPMNLALGDYNGDGFEDVAITHPGSNRITLLPGTGDGNLMSGRSFEAGGVPSGIVSADFDGDGITDLAFAVKSTNKVYVYEGSSDGNFSLAADIGLEGSLSNLTTGDFNGDGIPDLAVMASSISKVYVLQGLGDGSFAGIQSYGTGANPVAAAARDLNGDGKSDLLIAGRNNGDVTLLLSLPSTGRFELDSPAYATNEDEGSVTIRVNRVGGVAGVSSVVYGTADGSAIAGTDYTGVSGTLFFADGQATGSFSIPILDNDQYGGGTNKSFTIEINDPSHGAGLGSVSSAVVTIVDNDNPPPSPGTIQFGSASYSASGSSGQATVELTRTVGTAGRVTVQYATTDGSAIAGIDYEAASGTYTFEDGEAAGTLDVPLLDNGDGSDKTFAITLSHPSGGAVLGPLYSATVTLTNTVPPVQGAYQAKSEIADAAPVAGAETTVTLAVYRSDGSRDTGFNGSYDVTLTGYTAAPDGTVGNFMGQQLQEGGTTRSLIFVGGEASATLALHRAGLQEIHFEIGQVAYPTSAALLDVKTAAAHHLRISKQPVGSGSAGGGRLGVQPQVIASDLFGNPVADLTIQASRVEDGRSWILTGSNAVTDANGKADFVDLEARNTGSNDMSGVRIRFAAANSQLSVNSDGMTLLRSGSDSGNPVTPAPSDQTSPTTPKDPVNPTDPDDSKKPEGGNEGKPVRPPFSDIAGHWAYAYIAELYADGILKGYPDGTFRPNANMTRAEFTTLLVKALKPSAASGTPSFKDTAGHWAAKEIAEARASGIVKGFADLTFRPDEYLTREQMIAMTVRAFRPQYESVGANHAFTDSAEISAWAAEFIQTAVRLKWVSGYADGRLMPQQLAKRSEVAKIVAIIRNR